MIHRFKSLDNYIVLDVNSGSIHIVDKLLYDLIPLAEPLVEGGMDEARLLAGALAHMQGLVPEEILSPAEEILELAAEGLLFSRDGSREYLEAVDDRPTVVKAMCLHIAHDCNLSCGYCFAGDGEYSGPKGHMPLEVGKKALDMLVQNSGNRRHLEVDFFGGEPLLNWPVVEALVAYGRSLEEPYGKKFRFTLTTNGLLLTEDKLDFVHREMSNVVLSIDGRPLIHDAMRPFRGGQGSYDKIIPKYKRFLEGRGDKEYFVRGTFTRRNLDFMQDILHLAAEGFDRISMEPVVAGEEADYAIRPEDIGRIKEEYDLLAAEILRRERAARAAGEQGREPAPEDRPFHFFHFQLDLSGGPCLAKRLCGCGSGTEYLAVTPFGDLYPCHQFVGKEEFRMGHVDTGIERPDIARRFRGCHVYSKPDCRKCFARFYCSGGCAANAWNFHGDIRQTYHIGCELQRKRVECAIGLQAALAE